MNAQPTPPKLESSRTTSQSTNPLARWIAPLAFFSLAFAIRALPWPSVLTPERVLFVGTDAYYHARRVLYGLLQFPQTLDFDRYINFPHGATAIWGPLFDTLLVFGLRPFLDGSDSHALDRALIWVPPLLGASAVAATVVLSRRRFDTPVAIVAGALLCLLSGHFWYSQVGFLDHHAAVAPASVLLMAATIRLVTEQEEGLFTWGPVVLAGSSSAACLLLWPGMLLHLALAQLGVLLCILRCADSESASGIAGSLALANTMAAALLLAFGRGGDWPQFGDYSPLVLSNFQPWLLAVLALHMGLLYLLWRPNRGATASTRLLQAVAVGVVLLLASAVLIPSLRDAGFDAWRWLGKQEHFQSTVAESRALFDVHGQFGVRIAETRLSRFIYLFPIAIVVFAWHAWRTGARAALIVVPWALGLALVTLYQKRFFNTISKPLALLMAVSVVGACRWLAARIPSQAAARFGVPVIAFCVVTWLLAPMYAAYEGPLRDQWRILRGERPERVHAGPDLRALIRAADWMRANTPATNGYFDGAEPDYGVLALWGNGHVIEYVGRRATVTNSFGDDIGEENFRLALQYFASKDEEDASEILEALRVRYVLAESLSEGGREQLRAPRNLMETLYDKDGNGLSRHRLIFEAVAESRGAPQKLKIFEHVTGALVRGHAAPGTRVRAQLGFSTNRGRRGVHRQGTRADENGEYRLRLPYSTRGGPPALLTEAAYELQVDDGPVVELAVDERDVQMGNELVGPSLATLRPDSVQEASH